MADVTFKIKVTNLVNPSTNTIYQNVNAVEGVTSLYQAMCTLEKIRGCGFTFESKGVRQHPNQHFIKSINGLPEDPKKFYWKICKGDLTNRMQQSLDSIQPKKDEKYIFAYTNTPGGHDVAMGGRRVTFTIEVTTKLVNPSTRVYNVNAVEGESLYQAMCKLQNTPESGFNFESYEVREHEGHHYISSINGLAEDRARLHYWKIYEGGNQTPEGVDFRTPRRGEQYKFEYEHTPDLHANRPR